MRHWSSAAGSRQADLAYYSGCYNGAGTRFSGPAKHPWCCRSADNALLALLQHRA